MRWASNMSDKRMQISLTIADRESLQLNEDSWVTARSISLSLQLCISVLCAGVVSTVGRLYSSLFCVLCYHADKPGGCRGSMFCSEAGAVAGRLLPRSPRHLYCTRSTAATSSVSDLHLRHLAHSNVFTKFSPSSLKNFVSDYTVVGGGESEDFLMFLSKIGQIHIKILANLCNKLKNLAKNLPCLFFVEQLSK